MSVDVRLGYAYPIGYFTGQPVDGFNLVFVYDSVLPIQVDAEWHLLDDRLRVGALANINAGVLGGACGVDGACSAELFRAGVSARYDLYPQLFPHLWAGVSASYEHAGFSFQGLRATYDGPTVGVLIGVDFLNFGRGTLGAFVDGETGMFVSQTVATVTAPIIRPAFHGWFIAGVRGELGFLEPPVGASEHGKTQPADPFLR